MKEIKAMKELRAGSEEALQFFIHKYNAYVTTVIFNIIGTAMDMADIEEVAADVFVALWQHAEAVHSVKGFLGTVARNKAKNKMRQIGQEVPLDDGILVVEELPPEMCAEKKELAAAVKKAVMRLPQPDREIFLRHYYYYQTQEEIAAEMGINISTIKTKLRRGRIRLKKSLIRYLS